MRKISPLYWKAQKIPQVCDSVKTAETRSADKITDDSIYFARLIFEIYKGKVSERQIPVEIFSDSKPLLTSLYSTRPVERKTVRHLVQGMKEALERGEVRNFVWVKSSEQLADILTKESVAGEDLMTTIKEGKFPRKYEANEEAKKWGKYANL